MHENSNFSKITKNVKKGSKFEICHFYFKRAIGVLSIFSLRAFGRSGYCDPKRRRRRWRRRWRRRHTFVPRQNLRTVIGINLLFFLNDWYE